MTTLPFYIVTLSHASWDEALACARALPRLALPELRLDLFPEADPEALVDALGRRCVVSCRRTSEGGRWNGTEPERLERLLAATRSRPAWIDLEWDLEIPEGIRGLGFTRLLRSVHAAPGCFDLEERLHALPEGDAFKWVGVASELADNGRIIAPLAFAHDRGLVLSAFLAGEKGLPGRAMQAAWGGAFTYAAPDDAPPAAPGQVPLQTMMAWRCHRLHPGYGLCSVLGSPVAHSRGPAFHNARFQGAFKDLIYLPLECATAEEAARALDALGILGASLTSPLKASLPARLGLPGPANTLWRRRAGDPWRTANTDAEALNQVLPRLEPGPVLILGDGAVAETSRNVLEAAGRPCLVHARRSPVDPRAITALAPVGVLQATRLGLDAPDPLPFPEALETALPTLRWAVEWIYKEDTAFARWARDAGLALVEGVELFAFQAEGQSKRFIEGCGGED